MAMIDPYDDDFGAICNCAVRYAVGRRTYMPSLVIDFITQHLSELTDKTLWCFQRDLYQRLDEGFDFGYEPDDTANVTSDIKKIFRLTLHLSTSNPLETREQCPSLRDWCV